MNTTDYIQEGKMQLTNTDHYEMLDFGPTERFNKCIHPLFDQAWRLNIINEDIGAH